MTEIDQDELEQLRSDAFDLQLLQRTHNDRGEPMPGNPERLSLVGIDSVTVQDGQVRIAVTFEYDTWCCVDPHEFADAVKAVTRTVRES